MQRKTGIVIDLRNLAAISDIAVFREMCSWLEQQQEWRQPYRDSRTNWAGLGLKRQTQVHTRRHINYVHRPNIGGIQCAHF